MGNFVTLLHRSDFNDLFKFGHLFVHNVVPFEGELTDHSEDKMLFDAVTAYMNTYDYSTEYLILHFNKYSFSGSSVEIFIKDVVSVFAIDKDAHVTLSASLDPRINLQISCWTNFFIDLKMKHSVRQSKAGMFNCFEIFDISDEERKQVYKLIPQHFVEDLFVDLFNQKRPEGDKSIWTYLLRYERHHPYWKDMRGYFSDAIHVFENFKQKHEIDYEIADEVQLGDLLLRCGTNFSEIYRTIMETNPSEYMVDGCNYFAVAGLFLYMNGLFRDGGITISKLRQNEHLINGTTHKKYKLDFALAVALLGIKLGQELTYSCYYEIQNLTIFNKTIIQPSRINKELPIVDPDDGKSLSLEDAQELLNNQYNKIIELSSLVQELKQTIQQTPNNVPQSQKSQQENETMPVIQEESSDIDHEQQQTNRLDEAVTEPISGQEMTIKTINPDKENEPLKTPTGKSDNSQETIEQNNVIQSSENKSNSYVEQKISFDGDFEPVLMKRLVKNRTKFYANDNGRYAHSQEEYDNLRKDRYERADYFESNNN